MADNISPVLRDTKMSLALHAPTGFTVTDGQTHVSYFTSRTLDSSNTEFISVIKVIFGSLSTMAAPTVYRTDLDIPSPRPMM